MQVLHPILYHHPFLRHCLVFATFLGLAVFSVAFLLSGKDDKEKIDKEDKDQ
jgi:hypothetical protein